MLNSSIVCVIQYSCVHRRQRWIFMLIHIVHINTSFPQNKKENRIEHEKKNLQIGKYQNGLLNTATYLRTFKITYIECGFVLSGLAF